MGRFDAIIAANALHAQGRVAGLTLVERARRVAVRAGADRVLVLDGDTTTCEFARSLAPNAGVLFIDARAQVVHTDLVKPVAGSDAERLVVVDDAGYAGALWAGPSASQELIAALNDSPNDGDASLAERWLADPSARIELEAGAIARHQATNRAERKAAARMLYGIIHKGQDGPITRYIYRPVSLPITRVLLQLPITPNQVTIFCAALSAVGIYLTAQYSYASVVWGAALIQIAGFLDGCDGEIARLKLLSSKLGAWLDTVVDEATSVGYVGALGYHVYLHHGDSWLYSLIFVALATHLIPIYVIYYYLIVVAGSGNSQDYQGKVQIVGGSGGEPWRLEPVPEPPKQRGPILAWCAEYIPHVLRRDFLALMAMGLVVLNQTEILYGILFTGSVIAVSVLTPEHFLLRLKLRKLNKLKA